MVPIWIAPIVVDRFPQKEECANITRKSTANHFRIEHVKIVVQNFMTQNRDVRFAVIVSLMPVNLMGTSEEPKRRQVVTSAGVILTTILPTKKGSGVPNA